MAVNKNFVVKNGLEVDTDLIFADASTNKVGIGSTIPATELDVIGGIAATDINITGVGTIVSIKGTTADVPTIVATSLQATNLNITGVSTGISVGTQSELLVTGVTSTGSLQVVGTGNIRTGIITTLQSENGNFSGILTAASLGTGFGVGIRTTGAVVGYGFTILNFVGAGNTFAVDGKTVDISIAGGGGSGASVSIGSEAPSDPQSGNLWYHTEYGRTFVWFDEEALGIGNTAVWVDAAPFNQGGLFLNKYGDNALGAIGYTGGTTSQASVYFTGDPNTGLYRPSADHVGVVAGGTASLVVNPNGISVTGIITGNGSGLTGVASTDNIITSTEAKLLGGVVLSGVSTFQNSDVNFQGSQAGVTSITFDASADTLQFQDQSYLKFGAAGDLQIYHDSVNSYVKDSGTGVLRIASNQIQVTNAAASEVQANFIENGAVELYYDNTKRLETASTDKGGGVIVTGKIVGTAATIGTGVTINNTGIDAGIAAGIVTASSFVGGIQITSAGTDATHYLTFVDSSGDQSGETLKSYTSLKCNPSSGTVTATEFVGGGAGLTGLAGGGGEFNTGISEYATYAVTTSMATAFTSNASASHRTIIHSCRVTNISGSEVTISGQLYGTTAFAHTIPVPAGSAVELFKKPKVLGNNDTIQLQCSANSALQATVAAERQENTDLAGAGLDLTSASETDLFTLSAAAVVESILCTNDDGTNDVKATVAWTNGSNTVQAYLSYELIIPAQASVELLENPLAMPSGHKIRVTANQANRLEVLAAYKVAS